MAQAGDRLWCTRRCTVSNIGITCTSSEPYISLNNRRFEPFRPSRRVAPRNSASGTKPDFAVADRRSGSECRVDLSPDHQQAGHAVVARSEFFAWIFCADVLSVRGLGSTKPVRQAETTGRVVGSVATGGGNDDPDRRVAGSGIVPGAFLAAGHTGGAGDFLTGMELHAGVLIPLGLPAADDSHSHYLV
jgi:hypothetical protein